MTTDPTGQIDLHEVVIFNKVSWQVIEITNHSVTILGFKDPDPVLITMPIYEYLNETFNCPKFMVA